MPNERRQDLEIFWPARGFFGGDDVGQVGNHHDGSIDAHLTGMLCELCVAPIEGTREEGEIEFTVATDEVPNRRTTE